MCVLKCYGWVVPLSRSLVEKCLLFKPHFLPTPSPSIAHTWGLCSSSGSSEKAPQCVSVISFHKDTIHAANSPKGCLIRREYPLPRPPRTTCCTQGGDCEAQNSAFIVKRNVWTPTRADTVHAVVAHKHTMLSCVVLVQSWLVKQKKKCPKWGWWCRFSNVLL